MRAEPGQDEVVQLGQYQRRQHQRPAVALHRTPGGLVLGLAAVEDGLQTAGVSDDHCSIPAAPKPVASAASISAAVTGSASRIPKSGMTGSASSARTRRMPSRMSSASDWCRLRAAALSARLSSSGELT